MRTYLPDLALADEAAANTVTVRQLMNHSAGWMGDDYDDFGRGDDALARYVAAMKQLPQLTPPGQIFAYNNAAFVVAGRLLKSLTGKPYETALQELVLGPLGLKRSGFFTDQLIGENISASHDVENDRAVVMTGGSAFPRSINSTGGLISSASERLTYARFHLGDGTGADGNRVLSQRSLAAMRANPGPGGTITMEIDGVCVRLVAKAHCGGSPGVPARRLMGRTELRLLLRTRPPIRNDRADQLDKRPQAPGRAGPLALGARQVLRVEQPAGRSQPRPAAQLREYEGHYKGWVIPPNGSPDKIVEQHAELKAAGGTLRATGDLATSLAFYRDEYALTTDQRLPARAGRQGRVAARRREAVGEAGVSRGNPGKRPIQDCRHASAGPEDFWRAFAARHKSYRDLSGTGNAI